MAELQYPSAEIERLWILKTQGAISDDEYLSAKKRLIGGADSNSATSVPPGSAEIPAESEIALSRPPEQLILAVILLPPIFVWFLLRRKYALGFKVAGLAWLVAFLIWAFYRPDSPSSAVADNGPKGEKIDVPPEDASQAAQGQPTAKIDPRHPVTSAHPDVSFLRYQGDSRSLLLENLRDPKSAEFRNVYLRESEIEGKPSYVYCGEVNSRNGFGGFTGFEQFIASPAIAVIPSQMDDFKAAWKRLCSGVAEKAYF